jgi:hypothetical protein
MESELSLPRNIPPLTDLVRGTDRVAAAMPKRDGRTGKGRAFVLGTRQRAEEEPSSDGAPAEQDGTTAEKHPIAPADDQVPSAPPSADGKEKHLDYQA